MEPGPRIGEWGSLPCPKRIIGSLLIEYFKAFLDRPRPRFISQPRVAHATTREPSAGFSQPRTMSPHAVPPCCRSGSSAAFEQSNTVLGRASSDDDPVGAQHGRRRPLGDLVPRRYARAQSDAQPGALAISRDQLDQAEVLVTRLDRRMLPTSPRHITRGPSSTSFRADSPRACRIASESLPAIPITSAQSPAWPSPRSGSNAPRTPSNRSARPQAPAAPPRPSARPSESSRPRSNFDGQR